MGKTEGKPKGKMSSYAFFVQTCREEHKKKHPGEQVVFAEFSKKCSEKWKAMSAKEKKKFEEMASRDKTRFENETANSSGGKGARGGKKKKKDPNAPKRNLSAFFFFCNEERSKVKSQHPSYTVGEVAKELGKKWEVCEDKSKYDAMAVKDKARYEKEIAAYRSGEDVKKPKTAVPSKRKKKEEDDDDEEDDKDDDDEEEEEDESD
ncbi:hypothetical protein HELRODRAFT_157878 [Helobdella robusta]|uniref:HMG box domain-containing protein n=1 Tax=Helobdella robusta TaxID=6412 RepID=T1EMH1_HELRO|nr:hypothetical protein HELRODRAFT_157878 [Helobdella robusta]ESN93406.1 hypothetical protein HELRODRAFT_157878 [Helobdella robusta]